MSNTTYNIADKIIDELSSNNPTLFKFRNVHLILTENKEEFCRLDSKKDIIKKIIIAFLAIHIISKKITEIFKDIEKLIN